MARGRFERTFSAVSGPSFVGRAGTNNRSRRCLTTAGLIQTIYGIDPITCHVLVYVGNGAPYLQLPHEITKKVHNV